MNEYVYEKHNFLLYLFVNYVANKKINNYE